MFVCFQSYWSLVRERNIKVIQKTISEAVVALNLFYVKSFEPKTVLCISKSVRILNNSQVQNLCHIVKHVLCLFVFNLDGLKLKNEI